MTQGMLDEWPMRYKGSPHTIENSAEQDTHVVRGLERVVCVVHRKREAAADGTEMAPEYTVAVACSCPDAQLQGARRKAGTSVVSIALLRGSYIRHRQPGGGW